MQFSVSKNRWPVMTIHSFVYCMKHVPLTLVCGKSSIPQMPTWLLRNGCDLFYVSEHSALVHIAVQNSAVLGTRLNNLT